MLIRIRNPIENVKEESALSEDANAGDNTLTILNTSGFTANDFIVLGKMGEEQTELVRISRITGADTLNLATNLSHAHSNGTPISITPYNQVEFSRKLTQSSDFGILSTVTITPDKLETVQEDTAGQTGYYYRARFYNSITGLYSSYSGIIPGSGFSTRAVKAMIDTVLRRTEDPNGDYTTREQVKQDLNFAYQEIISALIQSSSEYFVKKIDIQMADYQHDYDMPEDFREISEIRDGAGTIVKPLPRNVVFEGQRGYELMGRNNLYLNSVPEPPEGSSTTPVTVLGNNAFDENGSWVASDDASNVGTELSEFKMGTGSVSFDIDVSGGNNQATLTNGTFTSQDLSDYSSSGRWRFWVYIPNVTHVTGIRFRFGTDSANYVQKTVTKTYKDETLKAGWNLLEVNWIDGDETGTVDDEDIGYTQVAITYGVNQIDLEDCALDTIRVSNVWDSNSVYEIKYFYQPDQLVSEMDEVDLPPGNQSLLIDYAVAQILLRKGERDTLADRLLRNFEKARARFISQSAKRTRRPVGMRPFGRTRGYSYGRGSNTRRVIHSDGGETILK